MGNRSRTIFTESGRTFPSVGDIVYFVRPCQWSLDWHETLRRMAPVDIGTVLQVNWRNVSANPQRIVKVRWAMSPEGWIAAQLITDPHEILCEKCYGALS